MVSWLNVVTEGKTAYKGTEEDIDDTDEELGAHQSLPEVHGMTHLSQEGHEEQSTAPAIYY